MMTFLTVLHVIVCVFLILVVLLQAGKGGGVGIAFGGGGSQTVFGSSGAGNFLTKLTSATAAIFLLTSLGLAHYSSQQDSSRLQRLAEKKADEKKVEDVRAAKLKEELDKARAAAKNMGSGDTPPAPKSSELPPGTTALPPPKGAAEPAAKGKPAAAPKAETPKAETKAGEPAATPTPKKKRRAAPAPGAEGAPAAPAEAPAAPSE
jgi:preprotein translocase subunit SecG